MAMKATDGRELPKLDDYRITYLRSRFDGGNWEECADGLNRTFGLALSGDDLKMYACFRPTPGTRFGEISPMDAFLLETCKAGDYSVSELYSICEERYGLGIGYCGFWRKLDRMGLLDVAASAARTARIGEENAFIIRENAAGAYTLKELHGRFAARFGGRLGYLGFCHRFYGLGLEYRGNRPQPIRIPKAERDFLRSEVKGGGMWMSELVRRYRLKFGRKISVITLKRRLNVLGLLPAMRYKRGPSGKGETR
jgi:transposase